VSNRIGIASSDDPESVEAQLCAALPKNMWTLASDVQILHGRRICRPKPLCDRCAVRKDCDYYLSLGTVAAARPPKSRGKTAGAHIRGKTRAGTDEPRRLRTTRR
jgi:hypothetical protein